MTIHSETDWARLETMTDEEIDTRDIPPLDEDFFAKGELRLPKQKPLISNRVDADVLEWFKAQGPGYQTRILGANTPQGIGLTTKLCCY